MQVYRVEGDYRATRLQDGLERGGGCRSTGRSGRVEEDYRATRLQDGLERKERLQV